MLADKMNKCKRSPVLVFSESKKSVPGHLVNSSCWIPPLASEGSFATGIQKASQRRLQYISWSKLPRHVDVLSSSHLLLGSLCPWPSLWSLPKRFGRFSQHYNISHETRKTTKQHTRKQQAAATATSTTTLKIDNKATYAEIASSSNSNVDDHNKHN